MKGAASSVGAICRLTVSIITLAALSACGDGSSSKKYTIGGTISGLSGTVALLNNGGDSLSRNSNGSFTFASKVKKGKPYAVTVATQPAGQTCVVTNSSGTASADVTTVTVTCTTNATFNVGGNVLGLSGTVVLRNNGTDNLSIDADGAFTFATKVPSGAPYAVTVFTQPTGQTCVVTQGAGTMPSANVTNVVVTCSNNPPPPLEYSIGGNVSGLTGGTLQLHLFDDLGPGSTIDVTTNGPFSFDPYKLPSSRIYGVTVATQPAGQSCVVSSGTGTVRVADVTNISVTCAASTATYTIGGTITGLTGAGLKIENGPTRSASPAAGATTFTLSDVVQSGFEYDVGISAQPTGQTCVLIKSYGIVNNADITNVDVRCIANVTDPIVGTYTVPALVPDSYVYITLFADGVYVYGSVENNGPNCGTTNGGNGVEYGVYNYNKTTGAFTIKSAVVDTNGGCGVWANGAARYAGTLSVAGSGQSTILTLTLPGSAGQFDLVPVASTSGQIIGSWANAYHKNFAVFLPAGGNNLYYMITETQDEAPPTGAGQAAGFEYACASVTALTGGTLTADLTATCQAPAPSFNGPVDTNGTSGLSNAGGPVSFTVNVDTLTASPQVFSRIKPN